MPTKSPSLPLALVLSSASLFASACQHKSSSSKDPVQPATTPPPGSVLQPNAIARVPLADDAVRSGFATFSPDTITNPACGLPPREQETPDTVTLNVQDTPSDYTAALPRPIAADQIAHLGEYANGANCGRWVVITLGDNCTTPSTDTCSAAAPDEFTGATLKALVTNGCQSPTAACRDDRNHIELPQVALSHFTLNGKVVPPLSSGHWNTRQVTWRYLPTDLQPARFGFLKDSTKAEPVIAVDRLQSGIRSLELVVGGTWTPLKMKGDSGQVFILPTAKPPFTLRVQGISNKHPDKRVVYHFDFPASCGDKCTDDYTDAQAIAETLPTPAPAPTPTP